MIQLQPNETFVIYRALDDHTNPDTLHPQAVIRNAHTSEVLDTVDLSLISGTDHEYSGEWVVPVIDGSGQGRYVIITVTFYTDSGHTTKNQFIGQRSETYLIEQRFNATMAGSGGADFSYKTIRKIIREEIGGRKPSGKPAELDLEPVMKAIEGIPTKEEDIVDLEPVLAAIRAIPVPATVDLAPITRELQKAAGDIKKERVAEGKELAEVLGKLPEVLQAIRGVSVTEIQKLTKVVEDLGKHLREMPFLPIGNLTVPEKTSEKVRDIKTISMS